MIVKWAQVWLALYADKLDGRQFDVAACVQILWQSSRNVCP
jgi:hypothetical protein